MQAEATKRSALVPVHRIHLRDDHGVTVVSLT
jgi:hypothetical protein